MSVKLIVYVCLMLGFLSTLCATAESADTAKILRVEREEEITTSHNPISRRIPKFADGSAAAVREVYNVFWVPPDEGLRSGAVLFFDYRQARSQALQTLKIDYPFAVRNERKATFIISENAVRRGGLVEAWRVRLMMGNRTLVTRASDSWRTR